MEPDLNHQSPFIDLVFLTSIQTHHLDSQNNTRIHQKIAGLKVQTNQSPTGTSNMPKSQLQTQMASKPEIEIGFPAPGLTNPAMQEIQNRVQTIRSEYGINIFVFQSNLAKKAQTDSVTKIAELLATQKKAKILLINGLCHSRRVGSGNITPIYQVLRKSDYVNLYSMSFEGYFSTEDLTQQQKRVHELMQLFQISFTFIIINQSRNKNQIIETLLNKTAFQRFRLHFRQAEHA